MATTTKEWTKLEERAADAMVRRHEEIDEEIKKLRNEQWVLRRKIEALGFAPPRKGREPSGKYPFTKMTWVEAKQRRAEAGKRIWEYMKSQPKGQQFTRSDLEAHIDRALKYHYALIISEWNAANPSHQITDNGLDRNKRRYFVARGGQANQE